MTDASLLTFDGNVSHYLFLITPTHHRTKSYPVIISGHVRDKIKEHLANEWLLFAKDIYTACFSNTLTRAAAGHILEDRLHSLLQDGRPWDVLPMPVEHSVKSSTNTTYATDTSSMSTTFHLNPPSLQSMGAPHSPLQLHIFDTEGITPSQLCSGVYFRPLSPTQATFDSFVCNPEKNRVYVFQFTVSAKYYVRYSGLQFLANLFPGFEIIYIGFTPNDMLKLPFGADSKRLVTQRWHAVVKLDTLFAIGSEQAPAIPTQNDSE